MNYRSAPRPQPERNLLPGSPQRSTLWTLLLLFVVGEVVIIGCIAELDVLDVRIVYTPAQAVTMLNGLNARDRALYRSFNLGDFAFIALYSNLTVMWLRFLSSRIGRPKSLMTLVGLLPGLFDLVESIGVGLLLRTPHPERTAGLWLAVLGTPFKWLAAAGVLSLVLWGEVRLWRDRRDRT